MTTTAPAELRPMHRTDAGRLVAFHHSLSRDTTRWRFFTAHPELSPTEVFRFTHVDHHDREALVITVDDQIVAVGRYDRLDDQPAAEVAFVVADEHQGHGLCGRLFDALAERARAAGITRFEAVTLPDNHRMLRVFRRTGLPMTARYEDGAVHVVLDLAAAMMEA